MSTMHAFLFTPVVPNVNAPACPSSDTGCSGGGCTATDRKVCHCHGVMESTLREIIDQHGVATVEHLADHTPAGTGCQACQCRLQRMVRGMPAVCGGRFDQCGNCGCINAICGCEKTG